MTTLISDFRHEFQRHKNLADRALAQLDDEAFFHAPGAVNPVAVIVKHLAGNFASRWTDFLRTDGEKPSRNRDGEFVLTDKDTRASLLDSWERSWAILFETLSTLEDSDLEKPVTIRGESQTARQALLRGMTHMAYHVGQILYLVRWLRPEGEWLTIAPGQSQGFPGQYRRRDAPNIK
jgi:uncharacterized damage-inducible protein DinB